MLVVHAASSFLTLKLFVEEASQGLAPRGFRFIFLSGRSRGASGFPGDSIEVALPRGYLFFLAWFSTPLTVKRIVAQEPDVVHVHTPATALGLVWVLRGLKRRHVRLVYTARGGFDEGRQWVIRSLWHLVDPLQWKLWDAIGVVNDHLATSAQRRSTDAHISLLSLGGASLNLAKNLDARVRHSPQSPTSVIRLGWAGRFSRDKRPGDFVKLISLLRDDYGLAVEGIMMGDGDCVDRARIDFGANDGVSHVGWVNCPQELLVDCDVLVSTSVREGYGLVPVESALMGTPTIAYRTFGTSKSVAEVGGRLFPVGDVRGLARAVAEWSMLSDDDKSAWRVEVLRRSQSLIAAVDLMDEMAGLYGAQP